MRSTEPNTAENDIMTDDAIVPSMMRNPAISGQPTESQQNQPDDLDVAFGAIRDAVTKGDRYAAERAWLDLGAALGFSLAHP